MRNTGFRIAETVQDIDADIELDGFRIGCPECGEDDCEHVASIDQYRCVACAFTFNPEDYTD